MATVDINVTLDWNTEFFTTTYLNVSTCSEGANATQNVNGNDLPRMINLVFRPIWVVIGTIGKEDIIMVFRGANNKDLTRLETSTLHSSEKII